MMSSAERSAVDFLAWARAALVPIEWSAGFPGGEGLNALAAAVKGARVVALSEPVHGAAEPLELRNAWFRRLIQHGFTAIALESGLVEGRRLHDYFLSGGDDAFAEVIRHGLSWTFDRLPQNKALIRWLKHHNTRKTTRTPLGLYGFDLSGSPGNSSCLRGVDTALIAALNYLASVDPNLGAALISRLGTRRGSVRFNPESDDASPDYCKLSQADRNVITRVIADLIAALQDRRHAYIEASGNKECAWALRAASDAWRMDEWLRQLAPGWRPGRAARESWARSDFFAAAGEVRDRAQADHVEWILEQQGDHGRLLLFASRFHVSRVPVRIAGNHERARSVMGMHLHERLGAQYLAIGTLTRGGHAYAFDEAETETPLQPPPGDSVESLLSTLGIPSFYLDLRSAPEPI